MWQLTSFLILLTISTRCLSSSVISGGPYCSLGQGSNYAVPGTIVTVNCSVDNPDNLLNLLQWTIASYGVQIAHVNDNSNDVERDSDQQEFVSTVISSDNTAKTTTALLQFPAVSALDEAVVRCIDVTNNIANCTLQILSKF